MATGRIRVLRAIPGSTSLGPILRDFAKRPSGVVTSYSDSKLPLFRHILGDDYDVEIVSFSELVRNLLVLSGEEVLPLVQGGHKLAAIAYACTQLGVDSPFIECSQFPGFHKALDRTLEELHLWGIDADEMFNLAGASDPRLAAKMRDLAEIDRNVSEVVARLGRQTHTYQITVSMDSALETEGDLERLLVFADAEECPIRTRWLHWLAEQGVEVTVVLDRHASDSPIFQGSEHTVEQLGVKPESIGAGNRLLSNLFAEHTEGQAEIAVEIVSAADPLAEVEWALRGCMASDDLDRVGIYARDLESYAPLIESAAKRFGIQLRMSRRAPLLTNSFARLTLAALRFCASNDVRTLSPVLRSSYVQLSGDAQNGLETQLRNCYSQRSEQWLTLEAWAKEHAESHPWLTALLAWRRKAIDGGLRLPDWKTLLEEFLKTKEFPWVHLETKGWPMVERDSRASSQMERLLANHISVDQVTGQSSMALGQMVALCERLWETGDVSIPSSEVGIRVTSDPSANAEIDQLFVLGMLEGVFPRRRSEDPILTDLERHAISAMRPDSPMLGDSHSKASAERDEFYRVCAAARARLVFSYPLADDQRDNIPAFYLTEVERACGSNEVVRKRDYPRPLLAPPVEYAVADADRRLRIAMDGPRELPLAVELQSEAARSAIRPIDGEAYRPIVLRDALQCPFQYLVRHRLDVHVKRQTERWNSLRKLPRSTLLLAKKDMREAEQALIIALDTELDKLYADVPEWEMKLLRSGGQRLIRDWIQRESRSREEWTKEEGSVHPNVAFGTRGVNDIMPGGVKLTGLIDGISRLDNFNVAHIYGSAAADAKKLTPTEALYFGLHLLAVHEPGREGAIEIESMSGKRTLMVLGRGASRPLASSVADGLHVVDLATADDPAQSKKEFYRDVKQALAAAIQRIAEGRVDAIKGEHCDFCDYGELCRRSREFGEDDSPFGLDGESQDE